MADFDTANKRYSGLGFGLDFMRVRPVPDGTVDTADRLHLLPLYSGIAAGASTGGSSSTHRRMHPERAKWHRWYLIFKQGE